MFVTKIAFFTTLKGTIITCLLPDKYILYKHAYNYCLFNMILQLFNTKQQANTFYSSFGGKQS